MFWFLPTAANNKKFYQGPSYIPNPKNAEGSSFEVKCQPYNPRRKGAKENTFEIGCQTYFPNPKIAKENTFEVECQTDLA